MSKTKAVLIVILILLTIAAADAQDRISPELQEQLDSIERTVSQMRQLERLEDTALNLQTPAEYEIYLTEWFEEDFSEEGAADALLFYRALDLIEPDVDLEASFFNFLTANVSGYYDPETDEMTVILLSDEAPADEMPILESLTYVHEFVHALQDQHYDLDAFTDRANESGNYDLQLAMNALIEGDAEETVIDYLDKLWQDDFQAVEQALERADEDRSSRQSAESVPAIIEKQFGFPYEQGQHFVKYIVGELGWEGVDRAFRDNPPQTTEHIYHPHLYLAGEGANPVSLPDLSDIIGAGWRLVYDNPVGEFYLRQHLDTHLYATETSRAARGWGGDRMKLFTDDSSGDLLWIWHQVWDTANDATEFAEGYRKFLDRRYDMDAERLCWTADETHCLRQISETETRITFAADPKTALALLLLDN